MIYYPLAMVLLLKIRISNCYRSKQYLPKIICMEKDQIKIQYKIQNKPKGIAHALQYLKNLLITKKHVQF